MDDDHDHLHNTHGLVHPESLLESLNTLPGAPQIRVLNADEFAKMHTAHIVAHPPDGVLFPFLHGLEGDNMAQNTFFAAPARRRPPRFRGLVWVVAEDDLAPAVAKPAFDGLEDDELDDDEDLDEEEYSDEDDEEQSGEERDGMDVDGGVRIVRGEADDMPAIATLEGEQQLDGENGKHMHPVAHRAAIQLQTTGLPLGTPSSATSDGSFFDSDVPMQIALPPASPSPPTSESTSDTPSTYSQNSQNSTSSPTSLSDSHTEQNGDASGASAELNAAQNGDASHTALNSTGRKDAEKEKESQEQEPEEWDPARPPLLTCTFRARELLRKVGGVVGERPALGHAPPFATLVPASPASPSSPSKTNGEKEDEKKNDEKEKTEEEEDEDGWEFRPARVPDGISLRNFGIQVPIYATLSDIVVYSPKGLASGALPSLARRFAGAVRRKRAERCRGLGIDPAADTPDAPLEYNVFVLDADARALRTAVPELMMRVFEGGERRGTGAGSFGSSGCGDEDKRMDVDGEPAEPMAAAIDAPPYTAPPVASSLRRDVNAATEPNTVDFGQRERDEMRELTRASEILSVFARSSNTASGANSSSSTPASTPGATSANADEENEDLSTTTTASHWRPGVGQVFLGNSGDVPLGAGDSNEDPFAYQGSNAPTEGMGYDVCVECHEMAPFPSLQHLRAAEEHLVMLDAMWEERVRAGAADGEQGAEGQGEEGQGRVRPPPNANAVIHLPFPSAPSNTAQTMNALLPVIAFLERCLRPVPPRSNNSNSHSVTSTPASGPGARRWSTFPAAASPASFFPAPPPPPGTAPRTRSLTSPAPSPAPAPPPRTRPLKVLIYSSDGYTESSPLALSLLMAVRRLSLPEAYLELQVAKRRSFFVYPGELGLLRRVEARIGGGEVFAPARMGMGRRMSGAAAGSTGSLGSSSGAQVMGGSAPGGVATGAEVAAAAPTPYARPSAKSVSFAPTPQPMVVPSQSGSVTRAGRPRARTSPWLPSFGDHQSWFNDPRFDGSFPSRVLPFLYLGNLNHASNAYMLHALGITHVVSVGECALVPPPGHCTSPGDTCTNAACRPNHNTNAHFIQGKGPGNQGSLWIEEREGRIKVLDIKGVCDDGIDTLEPQLEPICEWIEKARQEGGQVLVHCRVGVSRSATVTIAYVMKHLSLPLVDAYLIVRSRRLSVLIQPNMRLLYNLCGWEIKLAKERAGEDDGRLRKELARTLTWPYLSKEVHALNEKYLH
ncbi:hypothetical protein C8R43DRAFT_997109 [Mycena crocata]|nr:hypothetical protein C8R43DRAFT_997109 [Mycena crocata]